MAQPPKSVVRELARIYEQQGYMRKKNEQRAANEGAKSYKKGDEVRFIVDSEEELRRISALLEQAGFKPGRPFAKHRKWRLPIYGREQVARLCDLIEIPVDA